MPRTENRKTKPLIGFVASPVLKERLQAEANRRGVTASELARGILAAALADTPTAQARRDGQAVA